MGLFLQGLVSFSLLAFREGPVHFSSKKNHLSTLKLLFISPG